MEIEHFNSPFPVVSKRQHESWIEKRDKCVKGYCLDYIFWFHSIVYLTKAESNRKSQMMFTSFWDRSGGVSSAPPEVRLLVPFAFSPSQAAMQWAPVGSRRRRDNVGKDQIKKERCSQGKELWKTKPRCVAHDQIPGCPSWYVRHHRYLTPSTLCFKGCIPKSVCHSITEVLVDFSWRSIRQKFPECREVTGTVFLSICAWNKQDSAHASNIDCTFVTICPSTTSRYDTEDF